MIKLEYHWWCFIVFIIAVLSSDLLLHYSVLLNIHDLRDKYTVSWSCFIKYKCWHNQSEKGCQMKTDMGVKIICFGSYCTLKRTAPQARDEKTSDSMSFGKKWVWLPCIGGWSLAACSGVDFYEPKGILTLLIWHTMQMRCCLAPRSLCQWKGHLGALWRGR